MPLDTRASQVLFALSHLSSIYVLSPRHRSPGSILLVDWLAGFHRFHEWKRGISSIHKNGVTLASHVATRDDDREIRPRLRDFAMAIQGLRPTTFFLLFFLALPDHYACFVGHLWFLIAISDVRWCTMLVHAGFSGPLMVTRDRCGTRPWKLRAARDIEIVFVGERYRQTQDRKRETKRGIGLVLKGVKFATSEY